MHAPARPQKPGSPPRPCLASWCLADAALCHSCTILHSLGRELAAGWHGHCRRRLPPTLVQCTSPAPQGGRAALRCREVWACEGRVHPQGAPAGPNCVGWGMRLFLSSGLPCSNHSRFAHPSSTRYRNAPGPQDFYSGRPRGIAFVEVRHRQLDSCSWLGCFMDACLRAAPPS